MKRWSLTARALLLVFPLLGLAGGVRAADDPPLQAARKAMLAGEPQNAIDALRPAVQKQPRDARLQAELAVALLAAGAHDEALKTAALAVSFGPNEPVGFAALGLAQAATYQTDQALATLTNGLSRHAGNGRLLVARGRVLWQLKRTRSAIQTLEQAARDADVRAEAQYWIGRIYHFRGWQSEGAFPGWHEEPEFRQPAQVAFKAAVAASPSWFEPHLGLGDTYLAAEQPAEALAEFDAAIVLAPNAGGAHLGRWRALRARGRTDAARPEVDRAARAADPRLVEAARQGYLLLGQATDAQAIATRLVDEFPASEGAEAVQAERIDQARTTKQYAVVVQQAEAFARRFPSSSRLPAVYDALLAAYQLAPDASADAIAVAVDARTRCQPDPGPYLLGANLLAARAAMLDKVISLAEAGLAASETFINENAASYKMSGKVEGSLARSRASAIDMVGWATFLKGDLKAAAAKIEEAERLSRGQDVTNQFHLGELARAQGDLDRARESYLSALTLQAGAPAVRDAARKSLAAVYETQGRLPAEFDDYLKSEMDRRRAARQTESLSSMVDKPLPAAFTLTDVAGQKVDLGEMRGKVLLLNFFSSW